MKRLYIMMGGLMIAAILMVISISQWNTKIETTTEKAKEDLTAIAEKDPYLARSDTPANDSDTLPSEPQLVGPPNNTQDGEVTSNEEKESTAANPSETKLEPTNGEDHETSQSNENNSISSEGKTESEILSAYRDLFRDLEIQETSKADQLLVQAKADHVSGKRSKADLVVKYEEAALVLERNADLTFNTIYSQLENDLKKYGHDLNAGLEFRNEYSMKKQARQSRIIGQIKNF